MYTKAVVKRFTNPKNAGEIKDADGVGLVGNVKCGDCMKVFIKVKNRKITSAKFLTYGCIAAIASSDVLCDLAKGKTVEAALKIKDSDIVKALGNLPPIKHHCSVLGSSALKKAIEDYKKRRKK